MWIKRFKVKARYIPFQNYEDKYNYSLCGWVIPYGVAFIATHKKTNKYVTIKHFEFIEHYNKIKEYEDSEFNQRIYFICG